MAINVNDVEENQGGFERKLYTGYAPVQIVAVNPNEKALAKLFDVDVEKIKDPAYDKTEGKMRLDFWYKNHSSCDTELLGKFSLWVNNDSVVGQNSGKRQYIDNYTKTAWAIDLASLSQDQQTKDPMYRLDTKTIREAKTGEEDVYELLKAYANARPKEKPFVLDSWESISKGKVGELKDFFDAFNEKGSGIKVPLTIRDGKYQSVFTKGIIPLSSPVTDYVKKKFQGQYGCKDFYGDSFILKEFVDDDNPFFAPDEEPNYSPSKSENNSAPGSTGLF
jgi:hypothetical protein